MGFAKRAGLAAALVGAGLALIGCDSIRNATGATKQSPDEFAVLTKAPLIIPPDYNLRPPQPGIASRNEVDPDEQARQALFTDQATLAAQLGTNYSDGEKLLLNKTNALTVDPNIRRQVNGDSGQDDEGPAFTQKVLFQGAQPAQPATAPAPAAQPASAAQQTPPLRPTP